MDRNHEMRISVNGHPLPDPSEWTYLVSSLDTKASRDATGTLHRTMVATKVKYNFTWSGLYWSELQDILNAVNHSSFTLVAPDPRTFNQTYTGKFYVGDRSGGAKYFRTSSPEIALYDLKMNFIEY